MEGRVCSPHQVNQAILIHHLILAHGKPVQLWGLFLNDAPTIPTHYKSPLRWRVSVHRERDFHSASGPAQRADPDARGTREGRGGFTAAGRGSGPASTGLIQGEM